MGAEILEIDRRLSRFDQRNTPAGLLCRYAAGRVKPLGVAADLLL